MVDSISSGDSENTIEVVLLDMRKFRPFGLIALLLLIGLDAFVWYKIVFERPSGASELYFLDVGQGDAELLLLPSGAKVLTDAGPANLRIVRELEEIPSLADRYIDIGIISHPQLDHFGGFLQLLDRYRFGAILVNGRMDAEATGEWSSLTGEIRERDIPFIPIGAFDRILNGDAAIDILSPDEVLVQSAEPNDTGIVELVRTPSFRALLTADTGMDIEQYLKDTFDLGAHVLKVGHHGSKYSSGSEFLKEVSPDIAVIEVGENRYGHPTEEALGRLGETGAKVFRTDQNGTIRIVGEGNKLRVFAER